MLGEERFGLEDLEIGKTSVRSLDGAQLNLTSIFNFLVGNTDFSPVAGSPTTGTDIIFNAPPPGVITLGDDAALGGSVRIFAHYGGGGSFVVAPVVVERRATIGLGATIMGDVEVGEGATVLPHSVLLPGFRVEMVACEPLVKDPIDIAWGPDGKLWVVEMADYPLGEDDRGKPCGRVRYLPTPSPPASARPGSNSIFGATSCMPATKVSRSSPVMPAGLVQAESAPKSLVGFAAPAVPRLPGVPIWVR